MFYIIIIIQLFIGIYESTTNMSSHSEGSLCIWVRISHLWYIDTIAKLLYYCTNLVINAYASSSVYLGSISKRWSTPSRTSKVTSIFCCLHALKTSSDCLMGTLSSILPGLSNAHVLYWLTYVPWMMYVGGKVNLPDAIAGAMLNALGGISVPSRRSSCSSAS